MLQKLDIRGVHTTVDENVRAYITKKIGRLDRYLARHHQQSAHAEVHLKEGKASDNRPYTCEATMHLPQQTLNVKERAASMYAAIDAAEATLKQQIQKYKRLHVMDGKAHRHLFARFSRKYV